MKRNVVFIILCLSVVISGCSKTEDSKATESQSSFKITDNPTPTMTPAATPTSLPESKYKDGTFEVTTKPDAEGYYVKAKVVIEKGKITVADWTIYSSYENDKPFDEKYREVYQDNPVYYDQAVKDWDNSRGYSGQLVETQSLDEVDAVSGATWTNKQFKMAISEALDQASGSK